MDVIRPFAGKALLNKKNKLVSADAALRNIRVIVLYFTGSWCSQYKEVTSILKDIHEVLQTGSLSKTKCRLTGFILGRD